MGNYLLNFYYGTFLLNDFILVEIIITWPGITFWFLTLFCLAAHSNSKSFKFLNNLLQKSDKIPRRICHIIQYPSSFVMIVL